ncbi:MAG: beta-ketoacyl-ACP synthase II [Sorangiineae bacterium]|nr:beta-ketoacyl-ACP synthase II [Polyangiaceae bacterium]MEB2321242.1 beta-ketoacyl-ACP synthase II [Sorangiineae bacterium]
MERVVVTGLGLVTPLGVGTDESFSALVAGSSGAGPITLFDATSEYPTRIAAEVKDFDPTRFVERKKLKEMARFIQLSLAATRMALDQANLELTDREREDVGVFIGVGIGGLENLERLTLTIEQKGPGKVSPYFIPSLIANMAAGHVSIAHGFQGPSYAHTSACSSSAHSLGEAMHWIRAGRAEVMIAGGAEASITPDGIAGFSAMFALSRRNDDPTRASRPWDKGRDGFLCGEGAGTLVLESLSRAKRRGARILAELTGASATSDAYHITKPAPEGKGAVRAMQRALADARLAPTDVDYINAHGTSTPVGDVEEARAIAQVFGAHALDKKLWVSSTKSMMGHLLGAAGAVEAAVCVKAIETGTVPPTINLDEPDPECTLDFVPHRARERRIRHAMSNSFGFGGTNGALIVSAFEG